MRGSTIFLLLIALSFSSFAQKPDFASPLNIPLSLNGNFGELRSNHFHAGIDLKTQGKTGLPVFCIEDGFVSRVAVSPSGYGNALYIEHPSGYTSVYGHLESFNSEIAKWVKSQQYKKKSFTVNLFPAKNQFRLSKGDEIAKSGNSGSSGGPHVHFEIRKTSNQNPVNPLFFDFDIEDTTKPFVDNLFVYPLGSGSHVRSKNSTQQFKLVYYGDSYHIKGTQSINAYGELGFGIDAIDYLNGNWSKCGIYQMEIWVDDQLINSFQIDELSYNEMRYLNSHIDYASYQKSRKRVHKTFVDQGNNLSIYKQTKGNGTYNFTDGKRHKVKILLYDAYMNLSEINFQVNSTNQISTTEETCKSTFKQDSPNHYKTDQIEILIPQGALYTDICFNFEKDSAVQNSFAPLFTVHNKFTPLHKFIKVRINAQELPEELREQAVVSTFDKKQNKHWSLGGEYEDGWIVTKTRTFGDLTIAVDTTPPSIRPLSIKGNSLNEKNRIRFKIKDEFSGIKKYEGTIDGNWVLFEYDAKKDLLTYQFDEHISKGSQHILHLTVTDQKNNKNSYHANFYY